MWISRILAPGGFSLSPTGFVILTVGDTECTRIRYELKVEPVMAFMDKQNPPMHKICRPWITLKNGTRIYARTFKKRAFCFWVDDEKYVEPKKEPVVDATDPIKK